MAALWALAALAYSNSFQTPLIFDSDTAILQDSRIWDATIDNVRAIATQDYWYSNRSTGLYRPLTKLTYLFNYAVLGGGASPLGYHVINFALHAANLALVYALGLMLLRDARVAFALAAIWGLHPVLTESVTNIVGRADLLAGFGVLLGLVLHIRGTAASGRLRNACLAGVFVAAATGIFSKESAVVLPALMLMCDLIRRGDAPWRRRLAGYVAVALPFCAYFAIRSRVLGALYETEAGAFAFVQNPLVGADFLTAQSTAIKLVGKYLALWLWPANLSADYSYNAVPLVEWKWNTPGDWSAAFSLVVCLAAAVFAIACFRRKRVAGFFLAFFFISLSPVSNFFIHIGALMAERFLYLPSLGVAGVLVLAVYRLGERIAAKWPARRFAPVALGVLAIAFAGRAYERNFDWKDERSLWLSAVGAHPESSMAHLGAAMALLSGNPTDPAATREIDRMLQILDPLPDPRNLVMPYATAGLCYRLRGDALPSSQGVAWYQQALAILNRGKRIDAALSEAIRRRNAAQGKPLPFYSPVPSLYTDLGRVYLRLNDPQKALEALDYAQLLAPQPDVSEERANAYEAMGSKREAARALHAGLLLAPGYRPIGSRLVALYQQLEPAGCALRRNGRSVVLNLACPPVQSDRCAAARDLAAAYARAGNTSDPIAVRIAATAREGGCLSK